MTVKTIRGRLYKLVGIWDSNMVFSSVEREDDEVMIYTMKELRSLIRIGRLVVSDNSDRSEMLS